jgi:hypothetical protein
MDKLKTVAFRVNLDEKKIIQQYMLDNNFKSYKDMVIHCIKACKKMPELTGNG